MGWTEDRGVFAINSKHPVFCLFLISRDTHISWMNFRMLIINASKGRREGIFISRKQIHMFSHFFLSLCLWNTVKWNNDCHGKGGGLTVLCSLHLPSGFGWRAGSEIQATSPHGVCLQPPPCWVVGLKKIQNGYLRRSYKQLRKEEKQKAGEKRKDIPIWVQSERVTGRKARGLQIEEIGCKCHILSS